MAEIRSQDKRDKLRLIYAQCKPKAKTLQDSLMAALKICDASINSVTPGTWLASTNEAGGGSSFEMLRDFSPIVAKRLIGELLDAYDQAVEKLTCHLGAAPNDEQIYNFLLKYSLRSVRKYRSDFTGGRYGVGFYLGTS